MYAGRASVVRGGSRAGRLLLAALLGWGGAACVGERRSAPAELDGLPRLTLVEELRVGSRDDPDAGFSRIGSVVGDAEGNVYVLELRDGHVRRYDRDGRLLGVIGGEGQGPGEFVANASTRIGVIGDTLWVNARPRTTFFALDGALLRTEETTRVLYEALPGVAVNLEAGEYLGGGRYASLTSTPGGSMGALVTGRPPVPTVVMDARGVVSDTLGYLLYRGSTPYAAEIAGVRAAAPQPLDDRPLRLHRPGGTHEVGRGAAATAAEGVVTVTRTDADGDTLFSRAYHYAPEPYTDEVTGAMMAVSLRTWSNRAGEGADTAAARAAIRAEMPLPPFQPPVSAAHLGADGVLWLGRGGVEGIVPPREWVLVGPEGAPLGTVEVPARVTVHWSDGATVWATMLDDLDVPWLVRYRLVQPE